MRDTVDKILRNEAERLLAKSGDLGLDMAALTYLDKLISTYKAFVGETPASETPPEASSTEALLDQVKQATAIGKSVS